MLLLSFGAGCALDRCSFSAFICSLHAFVISLFDACGVAFACWSMHAFIDVVEEDAAACR